MSVRSMKQIGITDILITLSNYKNSFLRVLK